MTTNITKTASEMMRETQAKEDAEKKVILRNAKQLTAKFSHLLNSPKTFKR